MSRADFMTAFVVLSLAGFALGVFVIAPKIWHAIDKRRGGDQ